MSSTTRGQEGCPDQHLICQGWLGHRGIQPSLSGLSAHPSASLLLWFYLFSLFTDWVLCSVSLFPAHNSPQLHPNGGLGSTCLPTLMASVSASQLHTPRRESPSPVPPLPPSYGQQSGHKMHRAAPLLRKWGGPRKGQEQGGACWLGYQKPT